MVSLTYDNNVMVMSFSNVYLKGKTGHNSLKSSYLRQIYLQDYFCVIFDINQETENVVSGIFNTMRRVYMPALLVCKAWGDINPPNPHSEEIIKFYISKMKLFLDYLESKL